MKSRVTAIATLAFLAVANGFARNPIVSAVKGYATPGFPFPDRFTADRVVAIQTGGSVQLQPYLGVLALFPFDRTFPGAVGNHFGDVTYMNADVLLYAEQHDSQANVTYFLWIALSDTSQLAMDFGLGSYTGADLLHATRPYHLSFFGGRGLTDGEAVSTRHGQYRLAWNYAKAMDDPGRLVTVERVSSGPSRVRTSSQPT